MFRALIALLVALALPFKAGFAADYAETFDTEAAQGWTVATGTWAVEGGAYHSTAIGWTDITVYGGGSWDTDFIYHARINNGFNNTGNLAGAVYNYQDANNYYAVAFAALGGRAYLIKLINGTMTIVAAAPYSGGGQNVWFDVDVIRSGTGTTVNVNGTPVFSGVTQSELGPGKIGLITIWSDARFDNVSLTGGIRDPLKWPFATASIWNTPIGSNAVYVPANIPIPNAPDSQGINWAPMPNVDEDIIVLTPAAPLTDIWYNSAAWTAGLDRCQPQQEDPHRLIFQLPMPTNYYVESGPGNNSAAFLQPDGRTLIQTQPFTRCSTVTDGSGTSLTDLSSFLPVDIYGDGIRGSHGGSGLSAIGGSIRLGELRPGSQGPRHALKVELDARQVLHACPNRSDCYRWPADRADAGADQYYGTTPRDPPAPAAMKAGGLLAIPASVDLSTMGLNTEPARQLAWTLQNYGAYIVDNTGGQGFNISAETGPDGSVQDQFKADYPDLGPMSQRVKDNTPWSGDMLTLIAALHVVDNNDSTSIGGGGTPRQPPAPPLAVTRSEESAAILAGSWLAYGPAIGTFSGGTMVSNNVAGSAATFSFTGTAVSWIGVKCNVCGIASVSIDGGAAAMVDTAGPAAPGSLVSEAVFYASGLATGVSHTIVITVTGTTVSGETNIVVDAFDVMP